MWRVTGVKFLCKLLGVQVLPMLLLPTHPTPIILGSLSEVVGSLSESVSGSLSEVLASKKQ